MGGPGVAASVLELIGGTPLVKLNRIPKPEGATVLAKVESLNPAGSVKDRIAYAMVDDAERRGVLKPGATVVEPTSGNTGVGLAMVCAVRGYRLILTMPDDMSVERQRLFARYGAEIHLTPAIEGMTGAVFAAQEMCREHAEYFMPMQFENPANPEVHRRTTAVEILEATDGRLDAFVAAIGTGGTVTGVGEVLKERVPGVRIVGVEPARSPVLSGGAFDPTASRASARPSCPACSTGRSSTRSCWCATRTPRRQRAGWRARKGSSSASRRAPMSGRPARSPRRCRGDQIVVTVLCDTGERYLSVAF